MFLRQATFPSLRRGRDKPGKTQDRQDSGEVFNVIGTCPNRPPRAFSKQLTDIYLLALAAKRGGPLATFDRAPPTAGSWGWRNKQHERDGGTAAPVFSLCRHRSKRPRLLIGGGHRRRRHITELGGRRRSGLRRGRTSRSRLLGARLLSPVISVEQPESPESDERRGYPRPDVRAAARPFGTTPLIVAARIGVAGVRHDSTPFLVNQQCW